MMEDTVATCGGEDDDGSSAIGRPFPKNLNFFESTPSLALTPPLHTPREDEAVTGSDIFNSTGVSGGVALASGDDVMTVAAAAPTIRGKRKRSISVQEEIEEGRKRRLSVHEDILGGGSKNSSADSLNAEHAEAAASTVADDSSSIMPEPEKVKLDDSNDKKADGFIGKEDGAQCIEEKKKAEKASFEAHHRLAPWSARRNLVKGAGTAMHGADSHPRWRTHQMAEDYVSLASAITLPPTRLGPFGYSASVGRYPVEQATALAYLTSPIRRPAVVERWNPYEIATFEAAMALHGKTFHRVQRWVGTKTTKEIVEFYYVWKKTSHGKRWKASFVEEMEGYDDSCDCEGWKGKVEVGSPAKGR